MTVTTSAHSIKPPQHRNSHTDRRHIHRNTFVWHFYTSATEPPKPALDSNDTGSVTPSLSISHTICVNINIIIPHSCRRKTKGDWERGDWGWREPTDRFDIIIKHTCATLTTRSQRHMLLWFYETAGSPTFCHQNSPETLYACVVDAHMCCYMIHIATTPPFKRRRHDAKYRVSNSSSRQAVGRQLSSSHAVYDDYNI